MSDLRLIIWDVDGTLVNSRASILAAMQTAFETVGETYPGDAACLEGVGLSIEVLFARLLPMHGAATHAALAQAYKQAYFERRRTLGTLSLAPMYDGARQVLDQLKAEDWTLMAIATGKSRRGLDALISSQGLSGYFQSTQTADDQLSKPNPAMILAALTETGVEARRAVMIGDTSFDMDMARAAGVKGLGVTWGYHSKDDLGGDLIVDRFDQVLPAIDRLMEQSR